MSGEEILGEGAGAEDGAEAVKGDTALTADKDDDAGKDDAGKDDAGKDDAGKDADHEKEGATDKKSEDGEADKGKDGAPEKYEDFALPEGAAIDPDVLAEFHPLLQEVHATQEQAQKFVDLQAKFIDKIAEAQQKVWADTKSAWKDARESDEEYGKGKYDESITVARKAMRELGGPALSKALEETGMGDHPELIRAFYRIGKAIGEDNVNFGSAAKEGAKTQAERMFPNQGKKK